jgi:hypothetical protein
MKASYVGMGDGVCEIHCESRPNVGLTRSASDVVRVRVGTGELGAQPSAQEDHHLSERRPTSRSEVRGRKQRVGDGDRPWSSNDPLGVNIARLDRHAAALSLSHG